MVLACLRICFGMVLQFFVLFCQGVAGFCLIMMGCIVLNCNEL